MARIRYLTQDASKLRLRSFFFLCRGSLAPKAGLGKAKPTFPLTTRTLGLRTFALASRLEEQQKSYSSLWLRRLLLFWRRGGIQRNESFRFVLSTTCLFFSNCLHARRGRALLFRSQQGVLHGGCPRTHCIGTLGGVPGLPTLRLILSSTIAIWLILPVVIRSSQRLSHACLSISTLYCETANGSLYQL